MRAFVRHHTRSTTVVLSTAALALVFAAVGGLVPRSVVPSHPVVTIVPHVNAALSVVAIGTIAAGVYWARHRDFAKHRVAMLTSTGLFVAFLALYLWHIVHEGTTSFAGPAAVYAYVYLPVLGVHMLLAMLCIPLVCYALVLASTHSVTELSVTHHRRVGRLAAPLWVVSFALGIVVYALLYHVYPS